MSYAEKTKVPITKTRAEIEYLLIKYGADKFFFGSSKEGQGIAFEYKRIPVKIAIPNPNKCRFDTNASYEREQRRMWRVLLIALKAKLEMIDAGLTTFETEFMSQIALPSGQSVAEWFNPQLQNLMEIGEMPKLLISGG